MSATSFGHGRERAVKAKLEGNGWFVIRAPASLGVADLVALKKNRVDLGRYGHVWCCLAWMIEVKSNERGGPFMNFRRPERRALKKAAEKAGAIPMLAYWPKRGALRFIPAGEWPADDTLIPNNDEPPSGGSSACAAVGGEV